MRLIDADEAIINFGFEWDDIPPTREEFVRFLKKQPTVDAVEVVHGHDTGRCRVFQCSECGYGLIDIYQDDEYNYPVGEFNYCPNCGAKIDGGFDYLSGEYTKRTPCNVPTIVKRKGWQTMTNADRIRAMSDDELIGFLVQFQEETINRFARFEFPNYSATADWLQQPAE